MLKLLEMQRHAMLMYTSCGWFFDELSGIETVQVIHYAGRVIQLAQEIFGEDLEAGFLDRLERAMSNLPEHGDGRQIYERFVKPAMVDCSRSGPIMPSFRSSKSSRTRSDFLLYHGSGGLPAVEAGKPGWRWAGSGSPRRSPGRRLPSTSGPSISGNTTSFSGVREFRRRGLRGHGLGSSRGLSWTDFPETIRRMDQHFGASSYSLRSLFRDEQRKILAQIRGLTLEEVWSALAGSMPTTCP